MVRLALYANQAEARFANEKCQASSVLKKVACASQRRQIRPTKITTVAISVECASKGESKLSNQFPPSGRDECCTSAFFNMEVTEDWPAISLAIVATASRIAGRREGK